MRNRLISFTLIGFLISACAAPAAPPSETARPSQTSRPTKTAMPSTKTPTDTPSPTPDIRLPYYEEFRVWNMGNYAPFRIYAIWEKFEKAQLIGIGWVEPTEGFKLIEIDYEYQGCLIGVDPVLVDENGLRYLEGFTNPDAEFPVSEGERIRTANCVQWVFGVPVEGKKFTLLLPIKKSDTDATSYYELDVDDVLYPPPAPMNCLAESVGVNSVVISWELPDGLEGDEMIRLHCGMEESLYSFDQTQDLITGLEPGTLYWIEVIIENEQERSSSCSLVVTTLSE